MNRINYLFILLLLILTSCSFKDMQEYVTEYAKNDKIQRENNTVKLVEYCHTLCSPFKAEHFLSTGQCICGVKK